MPGHAPPASRPLLRFPLGLGAVVASIVSCAETPPTRRSPSPVDVPAPPASVSPAPLTHAVTAVRLRAVEGGLDLVDAAGKIEQRFPGADRGDVSSDHRWVAVGTPDRWFLHDRGTGRAVARAERATEIAFAGNPARLALLIAGGTKGAALHVLDVPTLRPLLEADGVAAGLSLRARRAVVSSDGAVGALRGKRRITVYDIARAREIAGTSVVSTGIITSRLSLADDGAHVAWVELEASGAASMVRLVALPGGAAQEYRTDPVRDAFTGFASGTATYCVGGTMFPPIARVAGEETFCLGGVSPDPFVLATFRVEPGFSVLTGARFMGAFADGPTLCTADGPSVAYVETRDAPEAARLVVVGSDLRGVVLREGLAPTPAKRGWVEVVRRQSTIAFDPPCREVVVTVAGVERRFVVPQAPASTAP